MQRELMGDERDADDEMITDVMDALVGWHVGNRVIRRSQYDVDCLTSAARLALPPTLPPGVQAGVKNVVARSDRLISLGFARGRFVSVNTYSIVANTTPEAAFAYVADITTHPEWSPDSMTVEPEQAGPPAVGAKYKAVGHLVGKPNSSVVEITALNPDRSVTFTATDGNSQIQHEFTFTKDPNGTRIDRNVTGVRGPLLFKIIFPVLEPLVIRPGTMKCLGMLKDRLETRKN